MAEKVSSAREATPCSLQGSRSPLGLRSDSQAPCASRVCGDRTACPPDGEQPPRIPASQPRVLSPAPAAALGGSLDSVKPVPTEGIVLQPSPGREPGFLSSPFFISGRTEPWVGRLSHGGACPGKCPGGDFAPRTSNILCFSA